MVLALMALKIDIYNFVRKFKAFTLARNHVFILLLASVLNTVQFYSYKKNAKIFRKDFKINQTSVWQQILPMEGVWQYRFHIVYNISYNLRKNEPLENK